MPLTIRCSTISSSSQTMVPTVPAFRRPAQRPASTKLDSTRTRTLLRHGELDRAGLQHLGAQRGHLQHLLVGDLGQPPRLRLDARVGGVDAVHVGVDVAEIGLDGGGDGDGAGVGAAAAERGDAAVSGRRPGSRRSPRPRRASRRASSFRGDVVDARRPWASSVMIGICQPSQERAVMPMLRSVMASRPAVTCSPEATTTSYSSRRRAAGAACAVGPGDQLVGLAGHGRDHHGDLVAGVDLALDVARDAADALQVGHRRAAEFHHQERHDDPRVCPEVLVPRLAMGPRQPPRDRLRAA